MKSGAFGVLLLTLLLTVRLPAQTTATVTADQVRLRSGPSASAKVVAILNKDATVTVLRRSGEWVEVRSGFTSGYVNSSYLTGGSGAPNTAEPPAAANSHLTGAGETPASSQPAGNDHQMTTHPPAAGVAQTRATARRPFSAYAGVAGGSGGWGLGLGGGLEYTFPLSNPALAVRAQGEFFHFSGSQTESVNGASASESSNIFGVNGTVEYSFRTSSPKLVPYALGGLGFYYDDVSASAQAAGYSASSSSSTTSAAMALGGGLRFSQNLFAEIRFVPFFSGGSMFPIVVGYRF